MQVHEITDLNYERAVREYVATGDDLLLHEALAAQGFDAAEIQEHVDQPGWRMPQGLAVG